MTDAIENALQYLDDEGIEVPVSLKLRARRFTAAKADSMADINARYRDEITSSLITYFEGGIVTGPRNQFRRAAFDAFYDGFNAGWVEGGNNPPIDQDAMSWLDGELNAEFAHIDQLFVQVKELRKDAEFDYFTWITARADGYIQTAISIYNAGIMWAKKRKMLTWRYGDAEHCETCNKLNGQRHRAEWYIARNYFPGRPGSSMECGGYRCKCHLEDDAGVIISL